MDPGQRKLPGPRIAKPGGLVDTRGEGKTRTPIYASLQLMSDPYERDTYTWAMQQADALRRRSANEVDWDNVAEEIESVGKSQSSELRSRYAVLLLHLLKWLFQPERRSRSWDTSIRVQRRAIEDHLGDNPGLKSRRDQLFGRAFFEARLIAAGDLPVEMYPETNPFTLAEAMDDGFWPEPPAAK